KTIPSIPFGGDVDERHRAISFNIQTILIVIAGMSVPADGNGLGNGTATITQAGAVPLRIKLAISIRHQVIHENGAITLHHQAVSIILIEGVGPLDVDVIGFGGVVLINNIN